MSVERKRVVISVAEYLNKLWIWMPATVCWSFLCAVLLITAKNILLIPQYTAQTSVYVLDRIYNSEYERYDQSDIQVSTQMTKDSLLVLNSEQIAEKTLINLKNKTDTCDELTLKELLEKVKINKVDDSLMLTISVTDPDPYKATDIANIYRDTAAAELDDKMMIKGIRTVQDAIIPLERTGISNLMCGAVGMFLGFLSSFLLLFIRYVAHDAKREPEDIKEI